MFPRAAWQSLELGERKEPSQLGESKLLLLGDEWEHKLVRVGLRSGGCYGR